MVFIRECECGNNDPSIVRVPPGMRFCRAGEQKAVYFARCKICGRRTPDYDSEIKAIKAWNSHELQKEAKA